MTTKRARTQTTIKTNRSERARLWWESGSDDDTEAFLQGLRDAAEQADRASARASRIAIHLTGT